MAGTLLLKHVDNMGGAGTTSVDLYSGNVKWRMGGWSTKSEGQKESVWETINVVSTTTAANIRTEFDKIDELFETATKYMSNQVRADPVWLYWQSDGESAKRSPVINGESEIGTDQRLSPLLVTNGMTGRLAIERLSFWESESGTAFSLASGLSADGGTVAIGNDVGTLPQRINSVALKPTGADAIYQVWLGIRPTYNGYANFVSTWEMELGSTGNDTTASSDGVASGGSAMVCDFGGTATLVYRCEIQMNDVAASGYDDFVGRYLVLLRGRTTAGTVQVGVQGRYGYGITGTDTTEEIFGYTYLDSTVHSDDYYLYELGEVQIPPVPDRGGSVSADAGFSSFFIRLYAEKISAAAGTAFFDCLYLVPSDHMVTTKRVLIDNTAGGTANIYTGPGNHWNNNFDQWAVGHTLLNNSTMLSVEYNFHNWHYPVGGGLLVAVAQGQVNHVTGKDFDIDIELTPRWRTFRT